MPKKFDQELFDECDSLAKQASMEYIIQQGWRVTLLSQFDWDLQAFSPTGRAIWIECSVRTPWDRGDFPFDTVHVRMQKYYRLLNSLYPVRFHYWRTDFKAFLSIKDTSVDIDRIVKSPNKYNEEESFIAVPINEAREIFL